MKLASKRLVSSAVVSLVLSVGLSLGGPAFADQNGDGPTPNPLSLVCEVLEMVGLVMDAVVL